MFRKITEIVKCSHLAFSLERVVCRLLAAWCGYLACYLMRDENFYRLEYAQNISLKKIVMIVTMLFFVYSVVFRLFSACETDSWFLIAGATACVTQWLLSYKDHPNRFLFLMAVILAYGLFVIYFLQKNAQVWARWNPKKTTVLATAIAFGLFSGFILAAITSYRYLTYSSPNFDFGLFVNMFYNMKETGLPLCTSERDVLLSHFAVHISPIYYVLLPFYMLFPSPLTLQIGQAVVLTSGVIPTLLLCRHYKLSGKCTALVAFIYSFYPALSAGCFYDIHENCFLTPLLLWMFYFFERKKYGCMYIFVFLTLMVKEDAAVYVIIFSIYIILSKKNFWHGCALLIGALVYFGIALLILQEMSDYYAMVYATSSPNPSIEGPMIGRFGNLIFNSTDGLIGVLKTAFVNPGYLLIQLFQTDSNGWEKFAYFLQLYLPLGFIPICTHKPSRWLLSVPILINLLTNYPYQYDIGFQYHFGVMAFLFYAAVLNLPELKAVSRRNLLGFGAAACCCLYFSCVLPSFFNNYNNWVKEKKKYIQMDTILDTIPEDASVSCSTFLLAHLANREEIYELSYHANENDVDYVVFDARYPIDENQMNSYLLQGYQLVEKQENLIIILAKQ